MNENKNLPAFPFVANSQFDCSGLTKREYFAAMAMQGLIIAGLQGTKEVANDSILYADELLKQLETK